jgi:hypothetical protein
VVAVAVFITHQLVMVRVDLAEEVLVAVLVAQPLYLLLMVLHLLVAVEVVLVVIPLLYPAALAALAS